MDELLRVQVGDPRRNLADDLHLDALAERPELMLACGGLVQQVVE